MSQQLPDNTEGVILDVESDNDENVANLPIYRSGYYQKRKVFILILMITLIGLIFCGIFVMFYLNGLTREEVKGTKVSYDTCVDLHCCQHKEEDDTDHNIDCTTLNIEECVSNDNICVWECDHHRRSLKNYKFMRFDEGRGDFHDVQFNVINVSSTNYNQSETIDSIQDILNKSAVYQSSSCGDVYRIELDEKIAESRLNDLTQSRISFQSQVASELKQRRLGVVGTDDRSAITTGDTWSNKIALIKQKTGEIGHCSGILISKRHILTAAHCVYDTAANSFIHPDEIYLGRIDSNAGTNYAGGTTLWVPVRYIDLPRLYDGYDTDAEMQSMVSTDWAIIGLSTTDTGHGYFQFGSDPGISPNPSPLFVVRQYPLEEDEMWIAACGISEAASEFFKHDCDTNHGSSGSGFVRWVGASQIIYGTHVSRGDAGSTFNYASRIDGNDFDSICDAIDDDTVC